MKLSLFFEIQNWKPWTDRSEYNAYWNVLELIDAAEDLGFETVWMAEHHMLPEWSHSSAPEVFLGAVSQRTKRIRLGHAVVLLPRSFNHVVRVAERTAALDILCNGRLEVGTGRAVTESELLGFELDPDDSSPMWEEAVHLLPRLWTEETVSHEGRYYNIPPRQVVPKPIQEPHPPLWLAGTNPATFRKAGEHGVGMIGFPVGTAVKDVEDRIGEYREGIKTCKPAGHFVNDRVAILLQCLVDEDASKVLEPGKKFDERILEWSGKNFGVFSNIKPQGYAFYQETQRQAALHPMPTYEERVEGGALIVGDPARAIDSLQQYQEAGADEALCWFRFGGIPHEQAMKSLKLMGEKVLPRFHTG